MNKRARSSRSRSPPSSSQNSPNVVTPSSPFIPASLSEELSDMLKLSEMHAHSSPFESHGDPTTAKMVISRQTSAGQEKFAKDGVHKNVHVVVKNTPFLIQLALTNRSSLEYSDFNAVAVEATLCYDTEPDFKAVDFVSKKPIQYKAHLGERPDHITMEIRIKVLSSQLEGMLFRIRLDACDSKTRKPIDNFYALSMPIKVVSKPEQVNRKVAPASGPVTSKKKNQSIVMMQALERLEKGQQEQRDYLEKLIMANNKRRKIEQDFYSNKAEMSFETCFSKMLESFGEIEEKDRPNKMRRILRKLPARDSNRLREMIDMIEYEQKSECRALPSANVVPDTSIAQVSTNILHVRTEEPKSNTSWFANPLDFDWAEMGFGENPILSNMHGKEFEKQDDSLSL